MEPDLGQKVELSSQNSGIAYFLKTSVPEVLPGLPAGIPEHKSVVKIEIDLRLTVFAQLTLKVSANQPRPQGAG